MNFIKKITSPQWEYKNKFFYFIITTCLGIICFYHLNIGPLMSTDSIGYSDSADILIALNFNLFDYYSLKTISNINPSYIYTVPVLLISLAKYFFGDSWQFAFMISNLILVCLSFIIFSKILFLIKVRPFIIGISLPILVLSVDFLTWPRYVLTDTIFSFLVMLVVYLITKSIIKDKINYFILIFVIFLIFLTRPTSLPFIFAVIIFIGITKTQFNYNPKKILLLILAIFILTPLIFTALYQYMNNYLINNSQAYFLIEMVKSGMIIYDRPDTWVDMPNTTIDVIFIYFLRILFFFNPYLKTFSDIHIFLNLTQAIYIFLSIIVWLLLGFNFKTFNKIVFLILLISFFASAFHAFTLIDYDWRYRFPIMMPLLIIFPISCEIFLRRICARNFKS